MTETDIVMILDNNETNRAIFETYLEMQGFAVCFTPNREQALQKIKEVMPDMILVNMMVPLYDEFKILDDMINDPDLCDIPSMVLAVKYMPEHVEKILRTRADDFVVKPFDVNEFIEKISRLIHSRRNQNVVVFHPRGLKNRQNGIEIKFKIRTATDPDHRMQN
jgi:CheY-like chemotaxis protein